jgi:hypothetical protein
LDGSDYKGRLILKDTLGNLTDNQLKINNFVLNINKIIELKTFDKGQKLVGGFFSSFGALFLIGGPYMVSYGNSMIQTGNALHNASSSSNESDSCIPDGCIDSDVGCAIKMLGLGLITAGAIVLTVGIINLSGTRYNTITYAFSILNVPLD